MKSRILRQPALREGGAAGPHGFRFEVTGGALCLDLANTVDERPTATPKERLVSYADLVSWGEQAAVLSGAEARRLAAAARQRPAAAGAVLRRARTLREALYGIFSAVARGEIPRTADLDTFNEELARAMGRARVVAAQRHGRQEAFRWGWGGSGDDLDRILWPVARAAADLMTEERLDRVRECDAGNCAWLFLDTSRNRRRRWCDMAVCGNRDKARRHYRRIRKDR